MTNEEHVLWRQLRNRQTGASFRRQCPLFGYVVDFFAFECNLAIEVDGPVHADRMAYDSQRDERLGRAGIVVVRFTNDDVVNELTRVVDAVRVAITQQRERRARAHRQATLHDPPRFGEGQGRGTGNN